MIDFLTIIIVANDYVEWCRVRVSFQWKHLKTTMILIEEQSSQAITTLKEIFA